MRAFFLVTFCLLLAGVPVKAQNPETLKIGESAPPFNLPGVDGRNYTLKDFADTDILVVMFTCNHCPTAQAYEDRINQIVEDYSKKGVAFVAISPNDPEALLPSEMGYTDVGDTMEDMKIRAKDKNYNFPYLYDGKTQRIVRAYGPVATPHIFIFDKARKLRYAGRVDDSEKDNPDKKTDMRNAIEALLEGKPVPVETTKTFGCSIKWADKRDYAIKDAEKRANETAELELIDENAIKSLIKNDSDKLRLINIWTTWCGPCVMEFPELVFINQMYRNRDFELITISADTPDKRDNVLEFLNKQNASNKNYLFSSDDKYKLIEAVDKEWPGAIPYTILIKPGGEIIYRQMEAIDPLALKKAIVGYLGRVYQ